MTEVQTVLVGAGVVAVVVLLAGVVSYNRFVSQLTIVDESWKQIDVELQRRHELIPHLVATVKGYAEHEREVLATVVAAREAAEQHRSDAPKAREPFEERLGGAVRGVLVRAEAYPDLKASANFLQLQDELTNTEDRIAAARRFYNGNVRAVNTRIGTFPSNVVAGLFDFRRRDFFELTDRAARDTPRVG
ncbi:MAG TPA: LemA family protein [Nocardioidaceae bacterium]|nr:LemA family protein [Nocardioidaceae bacterium]